MQLRHALLAGSLFLPFAVAAEVPRDAPRAMQHAAPQVPPMVDINYQQYVLANGLRLIVHEDHNAPVAAVSLYYHVGSKDEVPGKTGFAHLFEHLMFGGSENAKGTWFSHTSPLGASAQNGTTAFDRTNFYETVPVTSLDRLLWLESDRMGHLLGAVDQTQFDQERGVVQNEKRQRANNPFGALPETISSATYPAGHPYSWQPIGSIADLDAATLDDVRTWFRTWYGAANAVLVVSGDVKPADVKRKVEHYFGDIPGGPALRRNDRWIAKMTGEKRGTMQVATPEGHVFKVWNVPGYGSRDAEMLDIAARILGGGSSSRLYQRLVYHDKLALTAQVSSTQYELGGQVVIDVAAKPGGDLDAVEKIIDEEMARFLRDGPTPEELARYKFKTYSDMVGLADSASGSGALLAENLLYAGSPGFYQTALEWDYGATPAEVKSATDRWLSDGVYVLRADPLPKYAVSAAADRSKLPDKGPPPTVALAPPERFTLSNGLKVQLVERHTAPTFVGDFIFNAGTASDRGTSDWATAKLATAMTMEGTRTRSFTDIVDRQQSIGALMVWGAGKETTSYSFAGLSAKVGETLDLVTDVLLNPIFPEAAFDRRRGEMVAQLAQTKSTPGGKLGLVSPPLLYGKDHPYGEIPTERGFASLTLGGLRDWYHRWIRPDNVTLLIVGDVTEAQLRPMLEQRLAGWRAPPVALPVPAPPPPPPVPLTPRIYLVDQPGAEQSIISVADLTVSATDPRLEAVTTVNGILGGGFLGRLNMNLREDKHWSYGARSGIELGKLSSEFGASTSVQTDKTADAMRELDREFHEVFTTRQPTAAEIRVAKDTLILSLPSKLQGASGVGGFYETLIEYGLPDDYWNGYVGRIEGLTPAQTNAALATMLRPDELTWFIVGDLSKIEGPVRALKLGRISVVDTDGKVLR